MKTISLIPTLLALTIQVMVQGQTKGNQITNVKADKINLHIVHQCKKTSTHKQLPILGEVKKQEKVIEASTSQLGYNELKAKADEFILQAKNVTEHVSKLNNENKIMQLEIATELQHQALVYQQKAFEISFQNSLAEFNFNKLEFYALLKSANNLTTIIEQCKIKHNEAEHELTMAKEMMQEAYAMPNLVAMVGTMSNAEEKEYIALKKQNQAIEQLKTVVVNSLTVKENLVCLK
jgi:hypothetical protein